MSLTGEDNNNSLQNPCNPSEKTTILEPNTSGSKSKPTNPKISYKECLRNHAANIGGNVTDGCGEFMPSGNDGTLEALKCAACNCHRNFHRKEYHGDRPPGSAMVQPLQLTPSLPSSFISQHRVSGGSSGAVHWGSIVQPVKTAFGSGVGSDSSSEELNFHPNTVAQPPPQFGTKKRVRTKFTADQKEKMMGFAEKIGWRIPREDDTELQRFCADVGVKRHVFKVWMHNNKPSSKKVLQEL